MQDIYQKSDDRSFVNDVYQDTYYSLVTETYYDDEFINQLPDMPEEYNHNLKRAFVTEKTYKPLMYGHPYMVIGNIDTNTVLKNQGFEVIDIVVNLDELIEYCKLRGIKNDGSARSQFVQAK